MTKPVFIRTKLLEYNLTQVWLKGELFKRGMVVSSTELCSILKDNRFGNKACLVIQQSLEILDNYEKRYLQGS